MIKEIDGKFCVYAEDGTKVGEFDMEDAARAKLAQLQEGMDSRFRGNDGVGLFLVEARASDGSVWEVNAIRAGFSANASGGLPRYYPRDVIANSVPLIEGARVYAHSVSSTLSDEHEEPSHASPRDIVGWLDEARMAGDEMRAKFHVTAGWLREALSTAWAAGKKDLYGLSITAQGPVKRGEVGGKPAALVEAIQKLFFVSLVSRPAAGGGFVNLIESVKTQKGEGENMDKKKVLAAIKAARPELLAELEEAALTEEKLQELLTEAMKPKAPEKDLTTKDTKVVKDENLTEAEKILAETRKANEETKKIQCKILLESKMVAAKLPEPMVYDLVQRFGDKIFESADLDAAIKAEKTKLDKLTESGIVTGAGQTRVEVTKEQRDKHQAAMDNMLSHDPNKHRKGFMSLRESWREIVGRGVDYDAHRVLFEALAYAPRISDKWEGMPKLAEAMNLRESLKTSDWGEIFNVSMYKQLLAAYGTEDYQKWRGLVSSYSNLTNFQTLRRVRYGGYGLLPTVTEQGAYQPLTSPGNESVTYSPSKRGGTEDLTWEMTLNDDLGAIRDIPRRLGLAAIITLYSEMIAFLSGNPVIYDTFNLFDNSNHGANTNTSAGLAMSTLQTGIRTMRDQTAYGNSTQILGGVNRPARLWVPNELEATAFKLSNSTTDVGAASEAATTPNPIRGLYNNLEIVVIDDFTDNNDWFLTADPARMPLMEVGFLNGSQEPELFVQDQQQVGSMFNADKMTYKIRHVHGKAVLDWRGFYRGVG